MEPLRAAAVIGAFALLVSGCGAGEEGAAGPDSVQPGPSRSGTETADPSSPDTQEGEGGEVTISGEDDHRVTGVAETSIVCDGGGDVHIEAAAQVTVAGDRDDVDIDVDGADLTAEEAHDLEIEGSDSRVTIDTVRALEIEGNGNEAEITTIQEQIEVEGSDNTVSYEEGARRSRTRVPETPSRTADPSRAASPARLLGEPGFHTRQQFLLQ